MVEAGPSRIRLTPAGRYWLIASIGFILVALVKNINLLLVIGYVLLFLLVINWWAVRRGFGRCRTWVLWPEDVAAGQPVRVASRLDSAFPGDCRGVVMAIRIGSSTGQSALRQGQPVEVRLPGLRRGVFGQATAILRRSYPFGLVEVSQDRPYLGQIWVSPATGQLNLERLLRSFSGRVATRAHRRATVRTLTEGSEVHGIREYRTGDSPRWIHWRTTARIGRPMVREFDRAAGEGLIVVASPDSSRAEAELSFLASLAVSWAQSHEGLLTICLRFADGWRRVELPYRRRVGEVLRTLASWPNPPPETPLVGPPSDDRVARSPVVIVGTPSYAVAAGQPVLRVDASTESLFYRPPRVTA